MFKLFNYFNKGFDFTDESFYILSYLYPLEFYNTPSLSHLFGHLLLIISDQNILNLRYSGFFILIFSSLIFCFGFFALLTSDYFNLIDKKNAKLFLVTIGLISLFHYYFFFIPTPSYNLFNLSLISIYCGLICFYLTKNKPKIWILLINLTLLTIFLNKPTSLIILIFLSLFILKRHIYFFLISGIIIFVFWSLAHFYFLKDNFLFLLDLIQIFISGNVEETVMAKHNFERIFFDQISILYNNLKNSRLTPIFLILVLFSLISKKNFNFLFGIIFIFYILKFQNIFLFAKLLCIYNLIYFWLIDKKRVYLVNSILLFLMLLISISFAFGTNNRIDFQMNLVSIFLIMSIYSVSLSGVLNFKLSYYFSLFFIICLFISSFMKLNKINYEPYRVNYTLDENNEAFNSYFNKKLFENLYIDKDTKDFIHQIEKLFLENQWERQDFLLDGTLKMPGILLITDAKFSLFPSYFHKKKQFIKSYENLVKKDIHPWVITIDGNYDYIPEINNYKIFFKIENKLSQKIKFNYHKEINHRKYTIFKPTKKIKN